MYIYKTEIYLIDLITLFWTLLIILLVCLLYFIEYLYYKMISKL